MHEQDTNFIDNMPSVLGTTDISKVCGVTIQTVQCWIDRGVLHAFRTPGGHRRVKREDFLGFLERFKFPLANEEDSAIPSILIADDDSDLRETVNTIVARTYPNAVITLCSSGADALIQLGMVKPDLAILDVFMPGLNGIRLLEKIRGFDELNKTKVLIVTGQKNEISEEELYERKADGVLFKPFRAPELSRMLMALLPPIGGSSVN